MIAIVSAAKAAAAALVMKAAVPWTKLPRYRASTVHLNQVHQAGAVGPIAGACAEVIITTRITARSLAAAGKQLWARGRAFYNRPGHGSPRLRFWAVLAWQTLTGRDIMPLSREMRDDCLIEGQAFLPPQGVFTLAVNHTLRRWTPRLLATVHHATLAVRPDLARDWLVIVGYREASLAERPAWARWFVMKIRRFYNWIYRRWRHNTLRLPMGNDRANIQALREWKHRAGQQPTLVFPEGRGARTFEEIRPGAGRWLATLEGPVLPVSVWWNSAANRWQIVIGPPIEWSHDPRLHDLQIGLELAAGLPASEAPEWQADLKRWQEAYAEESVESVSNNRN